MKVLVGGTLLVAHTLLRGLGAGLDASTPPTGTGTGTGLLEGEEMGILISRSRDFGNGGCCLIPSGYCLMPGYSEELVKLLPIGRAGSTLAPLLGRGGGGG